MAKDDVLWFKHHSGVGRATRMRKMQFIYGHWGKGIYWDVMEALREEDGYRHDYNDQAIAILCDIIGCKDLVKFQNWFLDCFRLGLLQKDETHFYSEKLFEIMEIWETKKANGAKGGRGNKGNDKAKRKLIKSESKAKAKDIIDIEDIKEKNIPSLEEFLRYCSENTDSFPILKTAIELKYKAWAANDWKDGFDTPIKRWKPKALQMLAKITPAYKPKDQFGPQIAD